MFLTHSPYETKFYPNLFWRNIKDPVTGMTIRLRLSAKAIKTLKKKGLLLEGFYIKYDHPKFSPRPGGGMVDTEDLKSSSVREYGFEPRPGHHIQWKNSY
jgi:hypothetical protein